MAGRARRREARRSAGCAGGGQRRESARRCSIFLISDEGSVTEAPSTEYKAEDELQKLLADHIDLLPGAQINRANPRRWLLVKREAGVPDHEGGGAWFSIDHLAVDQDGVPTFIEVKRASDTRSRREVVAQMLDYAANGSVFWTPEQLRGWFEGEDPEGAAERLAAFLDLPDERPEDLADSFWQATGANLREGQIRLVFVADEIPASLRRLVEFLNEQMPRVEVLAVEIHQYRADGSSIGALVPRLVGQTSRAQAAKQRSTPWTVDEVLELIARVGDDPGTVGAVIRDWAEARPYIHITGGVGASYPGFTMSADPGQGKPLGVLTLYCHIRPGNPLLELRLRTMHEAPPHDRAEAWAQLTDDLRALGVPILEAEGVLTRERPGIPLGELTAGRAEGLLAAIDKWIKNVRAHGGRGGTAEDTAHRDT